MARNQQSTNMETGPSAPASGSTDQGTGQGIDQKDKHTQNLTKPATPAPKPQATPQPRAKTNRKSEAGAIQPRQDKYRFQRYPWTGTHYLRIDTPVVVTSLAARRAKI